MKSGDPMTWPDLKKLSIWLYPDPLLKRGCVCVEDFGPDLTALAARMLALMKEAGGIGLAGPQVGLSLRLFVCNPLAQPDGDMVFVNPTLHDLSGAETKEEGCLSLPGVTVSMRRATSARIRAFTTEGEPIEKTGVDLIARVWQHETDHLDGRLIIDHMSAADEIANRRALRQLRDDERRRRHHRRD